MSKAVKQLLLCQQAKQYITSFTTLRLYTTILEEIKSIDNTCELDSLISLLKNRSFMIDNISDKSRLEQCIEAINSEPILNAMCNMFNLNLQSSSENITC